MPTEAEHTHNVPQVFVPGQPGSSTDIVQPDPPKRCRVESDNNDLETDCKLRRVDADNLTTPAPQSQSAVDEDVVMPLGTENPTAKGGRGEKKVKSQEAKGEKKVKSQEAKGEKKVKSQGPGEKEPRGHKM